jgi:hypothetical protein
MAEEYNGPMPRDGFSIASVVISYFLVAGGIVLGLIGFALLKRPLSEPLFIGTFAAGAFVGGFVAGRASRGSTILEPGLGALLLIGTIIGLVAITPPGRMVWAVASQQIGKFAGMVGGASAVGALLGAFLSEKLMGEATRSSLPWILYTALATCGACFVAWISAIGLMLRDVEALQGDAAREKAGIAFLIGIAAGCLLSGLSVGASSRRRALLGSLVGAAAGALGFFLLVLELEGGSGGDKGKQAGLAIIAAGGGIVTLIGNLIGWALFGKRGAEEAATLPYH